MAAMKLVADGSHYDMIPFTVAMTQETFETVQALFKAARALAKAVSSGAGETQ